MQPQGTVTLQSPLGAPTGDLPPALCACAGNAGGAVIIVLLVLVAKFSSVVVAGCRHLPPSCMDSSGWSRKNFSTSSAFGLGWIQLLQQGLTKSSEQAGAAQTEGLLSLQTLVEYLHVPEISLSSSLLLDRVHQHWETPYCISSSLSRPQSVHAQVTILFLMVLTQGWVTSCSLQTIWYHPPPP